MLDLAPELPGTAQPSTASGFRPLIVGIGGTANPASSTERAVQHALRCAERRGARTALFGGDHLMRLPHYLHADCRDNHAAQELIRHLRRADGVIVASPGYHGNVSGLVKNALDYTEEMASDPRPYLDGVPVGVIATAYGWQAACNTLTCLRSIVHALRGWPTPLGVAINTATPAFDGEECVQPEVSRQIETIVEQIVEFAIVRHADGQPARRHAD